jgi:predicted Zn-dependent peptidase
MATQIDYVEVKGVKVPVIYEQDSRLPIVSMQLVFRNSGSIRDGEKPGLAKLSAKMMNEGTRTLGSIGFAKALDAKAIHLSANTGSETFVIEVSSLKEEFSEGVTLLGDLLKEPNISEDSLQKVKAVTVGSIVRKENDYDYVASHLLKALLFESTPLANPSIGTKESVESVTLPDIESFLKEHLVINRAIAVVGGDMELDEAKTHIASLLGTLDTGSDETLPYFSTAEKPAEKTLFRTTEQAYLYFGAPYQMKVDDEENFKARVATFILGAGGFGSRLMEEIRVKRGLAYSAYARVNVSNTNSYFMGYLQTKIDSLEEARQTVREVIGEFVKNGVTQEELDQAKKFLLGSEPLRIETLSQRLSRTFMEYYKGQELGASQQELDKIETLTLDALNTFIKEHDEITDLTYAIVTQGEREEDKNQ